jgi:hypothetical protein
MRDSKKESFIMSKMGELVLRILEKEDFLKVIV